MRIVYIQQHFALPHEAGGGRPWEFARRLVRDGHQVTVIAGSAEQAREVLQGVEIRRLKAPYTNRMATSRRLLAFLDFMFRASWTAARLDADLIFASSTPLTAAVPGIAASRARRKPFVFEVRDLWPSVPVRLGQLRNPLLIRLAELLERAAYRSASEVVALSPGMAEGVRDVAPKASVTVVPNASDLELFERGRLNREETRARLGWSGDFVVLYAGSFGYSYGLEWLVDLASHLKNSNIRVVAYGEGAASADLKRRAAQAALDADELFPGRVPKSDLASIIPAADVVLSSLSSNPALEVNSLNKVFDALAAGRPVLFNHKGWLRDLAVEHGAGWYDDDPAEAASRLRGLAKDGEAVLRAAEASLRLGATQFAREDLYRVFRDVLERANGR